MEKSKNRVGRPRKFKSAKQMQEAIDAYFEACDNRIVEIHTEEGGVIGINKPEPYTTCGLCLALDITRETLLRYENEFEPEFYDTIKKAKMRVQQYAETYLFEGKHTTGAIFNLKCNHKWQDKEVVEHQGTVNLHFDKDDANL